MYVCMYVLLLLLFSSSSSSSSSSLCTQQKHEVLCIIICPRLHYRYAHTSEHLELHALRNTHCSTFKFTLVLNSVHFFFFWKLLVSDFLLFKKNCPSATCTLPANSVGRDAYLSELKLLLLSIFYKETLLFIKI
jgi:hypothetical protein